jgi:hypothetical protein
LRFLHVRLEADTSKKYQTRYETLLAKRILSNRAEVWFIESSSSKYIKIISFVDMFQTSKMAEITNSNQSQIQITEWANTDL